ncbi:MAG TPA: IPT/TIG domain-containing protein, partial [Pyrinomonadaceae bacterium]|nr:IPT/TIG domain-containing protein [Pyrinomonadaceae bacterium]
YSYTCPPLPETDLFSLVVFAGALGGALHGLRSLYWYVGLRNLLKSWTLMYVLLPFTGATIAVIFYAVISAGFLPVQASKNISVATIAIAALVGLFSQQAAVKLKDIADAFFTKPAPGPPSESKPQGSVPPGGSPELKPGPPKPAISPASGPAGTPVKITNTGMKSVKSITFGGVPGTDFAIAADGTITVSAPKLAEGQGPKVEVVVTGDKELPVKFEFTYTK